MSTSPVKIELDDWEVTVAHLVGGLRHNANTHKQDASYYRPEYMEDNLVASRAAAVAEMVVGKYLGVYWSPSFWDSAQHARYSGAPDLSGDIEVRRVRKMEAPMAIRKRDLSSDSRIVVCVYVASDRQTEGTILGWMPAQRAWDIGTRPSWDTKDASRVVDQQDLYPIDELEITWSPRRTLASIPA